MEQSWRSLLKGKLLVISTILSISCLVYAAHTWLKSKDSEDRPKSSSRFRLRVKHGKERSNEKKCKSGQTDMISSIREGNVNLSKKECLRLCQALDDLVHSMHEIEVLLEKLSTMDPMIIRSLDRGINQLKRHKMLKQSVRIASYGEKFDLRKQIIGSRHREEIEQAITADNVESLQSIDYDDDGESISSDDSFISATEFQDEIKPEVVEMPIEADEEIEDLVMKYGHLDLYAAGISEYSTGNIPARSIRTKMLNCQSDVDFCVKLYCIRLAFQNLFEQEQWKLWFLHLGRKRLVNILIDAQKDHKSFEEEFDSLISYCRQKENWIEIEEELKGRQVCSMTFYDIVLDFIIMDAFDDLENPPYALTAVMENGWITNSIKETALVAAVWSLLKAKTKLLQNQNGFMSRLYALSQYITPLLVWGFLGPDGRLKETCQTFKGATLGFLVDIFNMDKVDFTSITTLANDIAKIAEIRSRDEEDTRKLQSVIEF